MKSDNKNLVKLAFVLENFPNDSDIGSSTIKLFFFSTLSHVVDRNSRRSLSLARIFTINLRKTQLMMKRRKSRELIFSQFQFSENYHWESIFGSPRRASHRALIMLFSFFLFMHTTLSITFLLSVSLSSS